MKLILAILLCCAPISASFAWQWQDLWSRPDEQATKLLTMGNAKQAAKRFADPKWRAVASYRSGAYKEAATDFSNDNKPDGFYNKGNALAHLGQYKAAIQAYDQALKLQGDHTDAKYNKEILAKLLKDQKQQKGSDKKKEQDQKQQDKQSQDQQQNQPQDKQPQDQQQDHKQQEKQKKDADKSKENKQPQQQTPQAEQDPEQQLADEQMLNRIPDDPGGLLRQKFLRDHYRKKQGTTS